MSAQCNIGPNVIFGAQGPFHTMRGHSTGSAHILLLRVPASNVSIVFYTPLQQYQGNKVDSLGVPTFNICYVASRLGEIEAFEWYLYRVPGTRYRVPGIKT